MENKYVPAATRFGFVGRLNRRSMNLLASHRVRDGLTTGQTPHAVTSVLKVAGADG